MKTVTHVGKFWCGWSGKYLTIETTLDPKFWRNHFSREYMERHGLFKKWSVS